MSDLAISGWHICAGDTLIGTAYYRRSDQPWYICAFEPTSAFEMYRSIFDEYASLVNNPTPDTFHIDLGEYYESNIEALNLRLQPFGDIWRDEVFVAQIYDANECWIRPV